MPTHTSSALNPLATTSEVNAIAAAAYARGASSAPSSSSYSSSSYSSAPMRSYAAPARTVVIRQPTRSYYVGGGGPVVAYSPARTLKRLNGADKLVVVLEEYILAARVSLLLRGTSQLMAQQRVRTAVCWRGYARRALRETAAACRPRGAIRIRYLQLLSLIHISEPTRPY